ncbi:MAG: hypothetical protein ACIALR_04425 [Blastopirellula sp. JB062]
MNAWKNQWLTCLAAVCFVAAMSHQSFAQGRGGRGAGGRGGMNAAALLRNQQVQSLLKLTDEQQTELKTIADQTRSEMRELFESDGDDEDRQARREKFAKMAAETSEKVNDVLTDAQKSQLVGILLKADLGGALNDPMVKAKLNITEEQSKKIAAARDSNRTEMREMFQGLRDASPEERREKMSEIRNSMNDKVKAELTSAQKAQIEKLTAIDFEIDRSEMRGRRGQQGRRGQRGGDRDAGDDDAI